MKSKVILVPPSEATGKLAQEMAPSSIELVLARGEGIEREAALADAKYMICYPNVRMEDAFYKAAPNLRLVQLLSAGFDAVDINASKRAKVPVCNNGGANAISVAEHALMLMLTVATARRRPCMSSPTRRWASSVSAPSARKSPATAAPSA
jgi:lactate dehydrogenase-like 2-hydroxyacid dehydrogenase